MTVNVMKFLECLMVTCSTNHAKRGQQGKGNGKICRGRSLAFNGDLG